jgi:D-alanyl-D-alanine carboxypeptidase/D-alanyl-D-alanine-endopeptidase (penicillin-binding protein 4)
VTAPPPLRTALLAVFAALTLIGAGGLFAGLRSDPARADPDEAALTTPLLSARRTPVALQTAFARHRLNEEVAKVLLGTDVGAASATSCAVVKVGGGVVTASGGGRPVIPASTLKVLTAIGVLARIDDRERFVTGVRATAKPVRGVLPGDLWIVGGGDPLLESVDYTKTQKHGLDVATSLDRLADDVRATGITQITGRIVGDDRRYDAVRVVPSWKRSYVSSGEVGPTGGLMIDDNFTRLTAKGVRVAATDVPTDGAAAFQRALEARGITVAGAPSSAAVGAPDAATSAPEAVAEIRSASVGDIVGEMLRWSDNTTAEMLVKELGFRTSGKGTTADGIDAIRAALVLRGVDVAGMQTVDGSGLDRADRVTCELLVDAIATQPPDGPFMAGLPVMGEEGTLRRRLRGTAAAGKVLAKTGSLNGVSSLAGRAQASNGTMVEFAIAFNGLQSSAQGVAAGNAISEALVAYPDAPALAQLRPPLTSSPADAVAPQP